MISYTATLEHYLDHLAPIWRETGGPVLVPSRLMDHARKRGVDAEPYEGEPELEGTVVVASVQDHRKARACGCPVVYMSHGNGQAMPHEGYTGGVREGVVLFLAVNDYAAKRWIAGNPGCAVEVIGCPKLDEWTDEPTHPERICISFHWNCRIAPETRPAFRYFEPGLPRLAKKFDVVGHAHPRYRHIGKHFEKVGIPFVADFEEVVATCGLYLNDCSSTLYEFAALDRPVVVLNAPFYRREVEHGLRFWEYADVGTNCDHPDDLVAAVKRARQDDGVRRRQITSLVYPHRGSAVERAVQAIERNT